MSYNRNTFEQRPTMRGERALHLRSMRADFETGTVAPPYVDPTLLVHLDTSAAGLVTNAGGEATFVPNVAPGAAGAPLVLSADRPVVTINPETGDANDPLFTMPNGSPLLWCNLGGLKYEIGTFAEVFGDPSSFDAVSVSVFRQKTPAPRWAKLCSFGEDGAMFGASHISSGNLVVQFDTQSEFVAGHYIQNVFDQTQPIDDRTFLVYASVETRTDDPNRYAFNLEAWAFAETSDSRTLLADSSFTITDDNVPARPLTTTVYIGQDRDLPDRQSYLLFAEARFYARRRFHRAERDALIDELINKWTV